MKKYIHYALTHPTINLFLFGTLVFITIFILGSDFFSFTQLKESEKTLQQLQIEKEKILTKKMETSAEQAQINQLRLLNRSTAGFTLANLCETSKLWISKIQLEKSKKKITENTFSVSLDLMADYPSLLTLIDKLAMLPWNINWETLHITLKNSKKTKENMQYPLQIKLKLAIENYYLPSKITSQPSHPTSAINPENSPFLLKRYAGKLIYNGKSFSIIDIGDVRLKLLGTT